MTEPSYSFRANLFTPERTYRIGPDALRWTSGAEEGRIGLLSNPLREEEQPPAVDALLLGRRALGWRLSLVLRRVGDDRLTHAAQVAAALDLLRCDARLRQRGKQDA